MRLEGRAALVTGGNRGIGAGIVERLATEGADVAFAYLPGEGQADLAEAAAECVRASGRRALPVAADLRDPAQVERLAATAIGELGRVDVLVNNAGIARFGAFLDLTLEDWEAVLQTNLRAAFLLSQHAARDMRTRGWGRIIHISSTFSQVTVPEVTPYSVSKAGLAMLARCMAIELGPLGITVNCAGPSTVRTPLNAHLLDRDDMERREAAHNPTRRIGTPADIAAAVAFLASDEAAWINGQNLIVDGGLTALSPQPAY